MHGETVKLA